MYKLQGGQEVCRHVYHQLCGRDFVWANLLRPPVYSQSPGALCGQVGERRDVAVSITPSTKSTKTPAAMGAKR